MGCSLCTEKVITQRIQYPLYSNCLEFQQLIWEFVVLGPDTIPPNTIALIEKNYIPKKVIICWPEISRQMFITVMK